MNIPILVAGTWASGTTAAPKVCQFGFSFAVAGIGPALRLVIPMITLRSAYALGRSHRNLPRAT
jgi:hypothetical protein